MFDEPVPWRDEAPVDPSLPRLHQIVYCSRAAKGVDAGDMARIVAASKRHNPQREITGLLVCGSGVFFQWIEGPRPQIEQLMAVLHLDVRHHDIVLLSETEEVRERLFPEWDMEQVSAADICDVLEDALDNATDPRNIAALKRIREQLDSGGLTSLGND